MFNPSSGKACYPNDTSAYVEVLKYVKSLMAALCSTKTLPHYTLRMLQ